MKIRFYTLWLVLLCILFFIIQQFSSSFTSSLILDSSHPFQIWRYVTSIFLHANFSHILLNMFALVLFGLLLEGLIGGEKFLLVFFISGIFANIISIFFYPSSLGASGAIFGIIGALMIIRPLMMAWALGVPMPMFVAGILYAAIEIAGLFVPSDVGHIAHLSGIASGILIGLIYRDRALKPRREHIHLDEGIMRSWEDSYLK